MKLHLNYVIMLALLALAAHSPPSLADSAAHLRPASLTCASSGAAGPASRFTLSLFDTKTPETDLDAQVDGTIDDNGLTVSFCANNGCDNEYCFVFFTDDLSFLARKKLTQVHGIMNYTNSELETGKAQTASIECKL
jgi:hypothetical protein